MKLLKTQVRSIPAPYRFIRNKFMKSIGIGDLSEYFVLDENSVVQHIQIPKGTLDLEAVRRLFDNNFRVRSICHQEGTVTLMYSLQGDVLIRLFKTSDFITINIPKES